MADSVTDHTRLESCMLFQEEGLRVNWQLNQNNSMVECQARDLEVRIRVLVQVQIFLLKSDKISPCSKY